MDHHMDQPVQFVYVDMDQPPVPYVFDHNAQRWVAMQYAPFHYVDELFEFEHDPDEQVQLGPDPHANVRSWISSHSYGGPPHYAVEQVQPMPDPYANVETLASLPAPAGPSPTPFSNSSSYASSGPTSDTYIHPSIEVGDMGNDLPPNEPTIPSSITPSTPIIAPSAAVPVPERRAPIGATEAAFRRVLDRVVDEGRIPPLDLATGSERSSATGRHGTTPRRGFLGCLKRFLETFEAFLGGMMILGAGAAALMDEEQERRREDRAIEQAGPGNNRL